MKLLNKIDAKVRKHAKVVEVLNEEPESSEEIIWWDGMEWMNLYHGRLDMVFWTKQWLMSLINSGIMLRNWMNNNNWMIITEVLQAKVLLKNRKRTCCDKNCWKHWVTRYYQCLLRLTWASACWLKMWFVTRISTRIHSIVNCNSSCLRC